MDEIKNATEPSLTELAERNGRITADLERHTASRNYLWKVAMGDEAPPVLSLRPTYEDTGHGASIDMRHLPQDVLETILVMVIGHEEQLAVTAWGNLYENAKAAVDIINKMKQQQHEHAKKQASEQPEDQDAFDGVLAFSGR